MRMEVGREASAAAAAAEGSVASDAAQKAAQRMRRLKEERQQWIAKRQQSMARQEKLLKLLELQRAKKSKGERNAGNAAMSEPEPLATDDRKGEDKEAKAAAAIAALALARKKELKELQARAQAAQEKQEQAASVLARNLKQLLARNAERSQASKRKRVEETTEDPPSKKVAVGTNAEEIAAVAPDMHPFAAGADLDVATPELAGAACFRIALRHLAQTGTVMSREKLEQEFSNYTGKRLYEVIDNSLLELSLASVNAVGSKRPMNPPSSNRQQGVGCWQPGRQFLKISTFSTSDADHIQALLDVEKQVVVDVSVAKKFDPMKILCHYELNGVCNDKNCSNYHQKDYEPVVSKIKDSIGDCADDKDGSVLQMDKMDQLLLAFAEFRGRIMTKWPVICTSQNSVATEKDLGTNAINSTLPATEPELDVGQQAQQTDDGAEENKDDFLLLDVPEELPALGDTRYFDDVESRNVNGVSLQTKVEEDPNDTDAWLLLAISHLELDVGLSDEAANLSDDARLQQQLVFLCKELNTVHRNVLACFFRCRNARVGVARRTSELTKMPR
ncbi:SCN circadian oscillatory protein (SCOP) [Phytophthora cinnamomi]|uniref:SCN circadian oscillatory protein (SCOP) n=1 Tax=Phytophthora cinnamomi TaxID=4785 RepID=UPI00355AAE43|nr:SCN circadian oscillatory protein (SCOP) [Phytophthora cinnamomi]